MADEAGYPLGGPTSDRIRSGDIPPQWLEKSRLPVDDRPADWAVAGGSGHGMGEGATRRRSAPGTITHDHQIGEASGMSREAHQEEAAGAITQLGETQDVCAQLVATHGDLLLSVASATGGQESNSEAGRNAFEFVASLGEKLDEVFNVLEAAKAELERYANGF
jgi:hypothetical protein